MAAACVDYFSGGRFILGLGTSHKVQVEPAHGLTFSHPVPRLKEYIEIIRMLLREGSVSYSGSVTNIERFDLWFEPVRRELPIYTSALFPKMLQISGEIAQGVLLNWCTLEYANSATEHVALGARRVGKDPHEVDVATLLSCAVVANRADTDKTRDSMRSTIASYAGRVPRYRRLMAEAGFPREMEAVHKAWNAGDIKRAIQLVPSGLIDKISIIGTPNDFRQRLQEYRQAGITLPIITPRVSGNNAKKQAIATIKAGAP
jgi:alkanesulfonate monooxygenase SsuD/methylene tetrahydromethanopterin reductase-like flavin-dependent oxidoreductase (luciferase family)